MAEIDPEFDIFRSTWAKRLGMSDGDAAQAFMRGEALKIADDVELVRGPGQIGIHLRVNDRGLDGVADTGALPDMISEWEAVLLAETSTDPRQFTKRSLIRLVGWNRHVDPEFGPLAMCAALWLVSDDDRAMAALYAGDCSLLCDIKLDHATGDIRFQAAILD